MLEPPVTPIRKANDGLELPATGFGTYKVNGLAGVDAIKSAIHQGYRLIDSAFNYENEGVVGRAIRESGVPREDIIVTSKLPRHVQIRWKHPAVSYHILKILKFLLIRKLSEKKQICNLLNPKCFASRKPLTRSLIL